MRKVFYWISIISFIVLFFLAQRWPHVWIFGVFWLAFVLLGLYDRFISKDNICQNYPVFGHFRYWLQDFRPQIQQYFINTDLSGRPFNRETREMVYKRAEGESVTHPFGTLRDIEEVPSEYALHSLNPIEIDAKDDRITIGGKDCTKPYQASRLNISAMSFGALSRTAVEALNKGAKIGGFFHNTGEGGLTPYHQMGGDIVWQIGTGYFACRHEDGTFNEQEFTKRATIDEVKMIEIKLSQGAKPAHGGVLPGAKVTQEIADIRLVKPGQDCISPPAHSAFQGPKGLIEFVAKLRQLSGGKPVGFKLCFGHIEEFMSICKAMIELDCYPDFITIDGAEGGTGAAPVEFSDFIGVPLTEALVNVHNCLVGAGIRDKLKIIASGKIATGFDMIDKFALGADLCNCARPMLFSLGCIQALRCDTNTCPTGITTQNPALYKAVKPDHKAQHVANFHQATLNSCFALLGAMGLASIQAIKPHCIHRRVSDIKSQAYDEIYTWLQPGSLLIGAAHSDYQRYWDRASSESYSW